MLSWMKLYNSTLDDPRTKKMMDSNLGFEGFGIYVCILLALHRNLFSCMHINQLRTMIYNTAKVKYRKITSVICDYELFEIDENRMVRARQCPDDATLARVDKYAPACHHTPAYARHMTGAPARHATCHVAREPFEYKEKNIYKEINKEKEE